MGSIHPVKGRLYRVRRGRLSPRGFIGGLVVGLVIIFAGFMGPGTEWIGSFFGLLIIAGAAIGALRVHEIAERSGLLKEIEVGSKQIILRCEDGKEIVPQIQKISVGVFEYGFRGPRRLGVNWIKIKGYARDETLSAEIKFGRAKRLKRAEELVPLKDDLQRLFGSKVEEKKLRFVS